jgi:hypothetical protein
LKTDTQFENLLRELRGEEQEQPPRRERGPSRAELILTQALWWGPRPREWVVGWLLDLGISPRATKAARRRLDVVEDHDPDGHPRWRSQVAEDRSWKPMT